MSHKFANRLSKLEVKTSAPFFMPLIDVWELEYFKSLRASYGIDKTAPGQVALLHMSRGHIITLDYDPANEELFETQLNEFTEEILCNDQQCS